VSAGLRIDLSARTSHNALLDCRLLASLCRTYGGRQRGLSLTLIRVAIVTIYTHAGRAHRTLLVPTAEELAAHTAFVHG